MVAGGVMGVDKDGKARECGVSGVVDSDKDVLPLWEEGGIHGGRTGIREDEDEDVG